MRKPAWKVGITTKLVWILVFFSLIPLSVQVYSLFQTAEVLKKEVGVQYQDVAEVIVEKISLYLAERSADAQILSRSPNFGDAELWGQAIHPSHEFVQVLNAYVQATGMYSLVQVVDLDGNLIAVNDHDAEGLPLRTEGLYGKNYRSTPWFRALQQGEERETPHRVFFNKKYAPGALCGKRHGRSGCTSTLSPREQFDDRAFGSSLCSRASGWVWESSHEVFKD